jgi:hypothetical protein
VLTSQSQATQAIFQNFGQIRNRGQMNNYLPAALAFLLTVAAIPAQGAGCIKGAVVGGVAGHLAHHHAVLGAIAGCAIGHHAAVEKKRNEERQKEQERAAHNSQGTY